MLPARDGGARAVGLLERIKAQNGAHVHKLAHVALVASDLGDDVSLDDEQGTQAGERRPQ